MTTQTENATLPTASIFNLFEKFIAQKSGVDWRDYYSDWKDASGRAAFESERRSIAKDGRRARKALAEAREYAFDAAAMAEALKRAFSGRLEWKVERAKFYRKTENGGEVVTEGTRERLAYTEGQYFPTEYRKAAASVLEHYIADVRPKSKPRAGQKFSTLADIRQTNYDAGYHWFDRDTAVSKHLYGILGDKPIPAKYPGRKLTPAEMAAGHTAEHGQREQTETPKAPMCEVCEDFYATVYEHETHYCSDCAASARKDRGEYVMTPGQTAYEEDVRRNPSYDDGTPRPAWVLLQEFVKESWERNPTPRDWTPKGQTVYVQFADNGNVRKWSVQPFDGGTAYNVETIHLLSDTFRKAGI